MHNMKAYLYYSQKMIKGFNNPGTVKRQISQLLTELFDKFNDVQPTDIVLYPAIIHGSDAVFVIDEVISNELNTRIVEVMRCVKSRLTEIIRQDQGGQYSYIVKTKIEPGHTPVRAADNTSAPNINSDKKKMEANMKENREFDYEGRSRLFQPQIPRYSFDRVVLSEDVRGKIDESLAMLKYEQVIFEEWGLYEIQPCPASALNFYGPPGTGKSMAAEAIAHKLGKKILRVTYADVESKYHGEGPKMVKAIFVAAQREDAVLFFDEADSLLSKRLTNTDEGTAQAINSMRNQLTICLDNYRGIVIFATNMIVNYDQAFLTRLINVEFNRPDAETRKKIWDGHLISSHDGCEHKLKIPLAENVDTEILAERYDFVGREIRNAVISACIRVVMEKRSIVTQTDLLNACDRIVYEQRSVTDARERTRNQPVKEIIVKALGDKVKHEEGAEPKIT